MLVITIIWRLCILWQPCQWDPVVDLYSSDTVKGTVEEYVPAFGKCALKNGVLCCPSLQVFHAPVTYVLCIAEGKLLFLGSSSQCLLSERQRWRHPVSCRNTEWSVTNLNVDGSIWHFSSMFITNLFGQQKTNKQSDIISSVRVVECLFKSQILFKWFCWEFPSAYFHIQNSKYYYCFFFFNFSFFSWLLYPFQGLEGGRL